MKRIGLIISIFLFFGKGLFAQSTKTTNDTLKFAAAKSEISIFLNLVHVAGMDTIYSGHPVSIFAVDNKTFEKLPRGTTDSLALPVNRETLVAFIRYHVIPNKLTGKDIGRSIRQNGNTFTLITIAGNKLVAKINTNRNITLTDEHGGESVVSQFDIPYFNSTFFIIR